jgi:hypothetical protein
MVEQGLANAVPVAIGFLANQVGLGDIGSKIRELIEGGKELVEQAIDWLIDKAMSMGQSVLSALGIGGQQRPADGQPQASEGAVDEDLQMDAHRHHLHFDLHTGELAMASAVPQAITAHIAAERATFNDTTPPEQKAGLGAIEEHARRIQAMARPAPAATPAPGAAGGSTTASSTVPPAIQHEVELLKGEIQAYGAKYKKGEFGIRVPGVSAYISHDSLVEMKRTTDDVARTLSERTSVVTDAGERVVLGRLAQELTSLVASVDALLPLQPAGAPAATDPAASRQKLAALIPQADELSREIVRYNDRFILLPGLQPHRDDQHDANPVHGRLAAHTDQGEGRRAANIMSEHTLAFQALVQQSFGPVSGTELERLKEALKEEYEFVPTLATSIAAGRYKTNDATDAAGNRIDDKDAQNRTDMANQRYGSNRASLQEILRLNGAERAAALQAVMPRSLHDQLLASLEAEKQALRASGDPRDAALADTQVNTAFVANLHHMWDVLGRIPKHLPPEPSGATPA